MIDRLEDDHENAKKLAIGLSEMDIIEIDSDNIYTNLVRFKITNQKGFEFAEKLKELGVYINGGESDLRMVTHYGIESSDIDKTIEAVSKAVNLI
jgi:threonine aldolase